MKRHHNPTPSTSTSKKMWEEPEPETETDELMALLGYNVKSSDMSQVAQNIQLLEHAMTTVQQDNLCQLASQTLHYNPSDMSSYLESILSEFNPPQETTFRQPQKSYIFHNFDSFDNSVVIFDDSDLTAIPGNAIIPPPCKRMKTNELTKSTLTRPVVLVDSQENGVKLVHALMACAEAIEKGDLKLAEALVKEIGFLAVSQEGTMKKVATYFAEGLARRIYKVYPCGEDDHGLNGFLEMHFYETCPYLKFAHFTANQGILEAFVGKEDVHVVDFGIKDGMQWPPLLQALATRAGGPPRFRLTGIGPGLDSLKEVGWKLGQMADSMDIKFEYGYSVVGSIANLDVSMFDVREGETIAVNSIFELHQLLANDGGIERVFDVVKKLKPAVFTVVEQEANHNGDVFFDRFTEALHYYSTMFDSLEGCGGEEGGCGGVSDQDKVMSEVYLGRQICNVVSCEGVERVERHENLMQWRTRFGSMGFDPVHLSSNAFKQASMLLALFNGEGYKVEENNGCLLLGWHTRPLIATSAWKLS